MSSSSDFVFFLVGLVAFSVVVETSLVVVVEDEVVSGALVVVVVVVVVVFVVEGSVVVVVVVDVVEGTFVVVLSVMVVVVVIKVVSTSLDVVDCDSVVNILVEVFQSSSWISLKSGSVVPLPSLANVTRSSPSSKLGPLPILSPFAVAGKVATSIKVEEVVSLILSAEEVDEATGRPSSS